VEERLSITKGVEHGAVFRESKDEALMQTVANEVTLESRMVERPSILVVDDEEPIRKILCVNLSVQGYRVLTACDSISALSLVKEHKPELVILDIRMPGKSGAELLPEIKTTCPDTAVVMASAVSETITAVDCLKEGAYDYIAKPFNVNDVLLAVARALEIRRLRLENKAYQQSLQQKVAEQSEKIRNSYLGAMTALVYALEAKDMYTSGHSRKVAELSATLASELGMLQDKLEKMRLAGLLHDIGKIGVKESILNKRGKLTDEEYQLIKLHPQVGVKILIPIIEDKGILDIVRHHHERYDGKGYPDGLLGNEIPLEARILAVADTYDALTSARPYRAVMSAERACAEIKRCSGSQFSPEVVEVFLNSCPKSTNMATPLIYEEKMANYPAA